MGRPTFHTHALTVITLSTLTQSHLPVSHSPSHTLQLQMVNGNNENRQLSVSRVFTIIVKLKSKCYRENVVYSFDECARPRKQCW